MVKTLKIDFSKVKKGGGQFNKRRVPEGDYLARIKKVADAESSSDGEDMWLFTIELEDKARAVYPYYVKLTKDQYWKVRVIFEAAGVVVPAKMVNTNPEKIVGRTLGVTMIDADFDGREQSEITAVFPADELSGKKKKKDRDDEDEDEDEEEEEEEEETEDEDEEEEEAEDEDEDEVDEAEKKRLAKRARAKARKERAAKEAAKSKKKKKAKDEDEEEDDELEELEIDEL